MRNLIVVVAGLLLAVALLSACRNYLPTNRYLQPRPSSKANLSTADARHAFDHQRHAAVMERQGVTCADCHRFDAKIDSGEPQVAEALSGAAQYPGSAACHYCHGPSETRLSAAPSACTTCHRNITPLRPVDHDIAWSRVHASMASTDPVQCQNCHRDSFCINCHQARDSILTTVHDNNYMSIHPVDARSNPMQCGSCHRVDFCTSCHARTIN